MTQPRGRQLQPSTRRLRPPAFPRDTDVQQFGTRVPKSLFKRVKLHCVRTDQALAAFVTAALGEKLGAARE